VFKIFKLFLNNLNLVKYGTSVKDILRDRKKYLWQSLGGCETEQTESTCGPPPKQWIS
jgi:hypothetical protein